MIWSETPPTKLGLYYVKHRESGEVQPGCLDGVNWYFMWPYEDWFPVDCPDKFFFGPPIPTPEACAEMSDHAEVGALLAKCCDYRLGEYEQGWFAEITLRNNETGDSGTFQSTQLAAIRAAVEAAEKGVRE